jgi:hypothetical protein
MKEAEKAKIPDLRDCFNATVSLFVGLITI